jgi:hypothetical protein
MKSSSTLLSVFSLVSLATACCFTDTCSSVSQEANYPYNIHLYNTANRTILINVPPVISGVLIKRKIPILSMQNALMALAMYICQSLTLTIASETILVPSY